MERVTLSDGTWVDLRGKEEITQRGRRGIQAIAAGLGDAVEKLKNVDSSTSMAALGFNEDQIDAVLRLQEATVVAFLAGWSRPDPLPTLATVGDLPGPLFDELSAATAKLGAETAALALDMSPGADGAPDPKDRSGSSENSVGLSKAEPVPAPTLT